MIQALIRTYTDEEKAQARKQQAETAARYKERTGNDWPYTESDATGLEAPFVDFALVVPPPTEGYESDGLGCSHRHPLNYDENDPNKNCWYSWNRHFWGTKWNGYDTEVSEGGAQVRFDTAWAHPEPVVRALSQRFPDEVLDVEYADEDLGGNLARYQIRNGVILNLYQPEFYSDEAYEMAAPIKYGRPYAELRAEWDQDEIDTARRAAFAKQIAKERGVEDGYEVIREEGLEVPEEIKKRIATKADADRYWEVDA